MSAINIFICLVCLSFCCMPASLIHNHHNQFNSAEMQLRYNYTTILQSENAFFISVEFVQSRQHHRQSVFVAIIF